MRINHNLASLNTYRQLSTNSVNGQKSLEKLSSGLRINKAGDDAAGLAISEKMRAQIRGLDQASRNAQDGISMIQTAEGALNETHSILQRMRELADQAANDTNVTQDRSEIQKELNQLTSEINRIGNTTEFNTQKLLNGGSGRTANIRYTVAATGDPATGSATGAVSNLNVAVNSVKAGTGAVSGFATTQASKVAADDGSIGSPYLVDTQSVLAGTGAIGAVTTTVTGGLGVVNHTTTAAVDGVSAGVDNYEITTNFSVGNTIEIDGEVFTAVAAGAGNGANQFEVGGNIAGTVANLSAALSANANITGTYTVSDNGTTTVTLTETDFDAGTGENAGAPTVAAGTSNAQYAFEITQNFTAGDELVIGDVTYTAGTDFTIGATIADTVANIKTAIEALNDANDTNYTISTTDPTWTGSTDNNILVFTANAAGVDLNAADMQASTVNRTAAVPGVYKFEVKTNFEAGQTLKVGDVTLTAGDANTATTFAIGDDINTTASNIHAALTAAKAGGKLANYTISAMGTGIDADTIELTEVVASGVDLAAPVVGNVAQQAGTYSFDISTNFSAGDKIEIDGVTLTAGTDFAVGATASATTTNLATAIAANGTLNAKYTATTGNSTFTNGNKLILTEKAPAIDGVDMVAPTVTKAVAVKGQYEFLVTANFAERDRIAIGGQAFLAGTDFQVGADAAATAANIKTAIDANAVLKDKYTVTVTDNKITLEEKVATGANLSAPAVSAGAIAGKFEFSTNALAAGSTITIDGQELTLVTGGTESQTAAELKTLIEANTTLDAKYSVAVADSKVTLTQNAGQESATAPIMSYTSKAGSGFSASMQIGANSGQSMSIDIKDMRAAALGVSSATGAAGQTVEVDGVKYAVAWTTVNSVTNGTDNVGAEYALDVSNHDTATAAVKVINDAINTVSAERSKLGAFQNRLEHTINNLGTSSENMTAAESRIRDVDMAKEMMEFTKNNILTQAAQAMLAQANQQPQGVLQLLR